MATISKHTKNIELLEEKRKRHIHIVAFPPRCMHQLQPLDRTLMGAFKTAYNEAIRLFLLKNQRSITVHDIAELITQAYLTIRVTSLDISAFQKTQEHIPAIGMCSYKLILYLNEKTSPMKIQVSFQSQQTARLHLLVKGPQQLQKMAQVYLL